MTIQNENKSLEEAFLIKTLTLITELIETHYFLDLVGELKAKRDLETLAININTYLNPLYPLGENEKKVTPMTQYEANKLVARDNVKNRLIDLRLDTIIYTDNVTFLTLDSLKAYDRNIAKLTALEDSIGFIKALLRDGRKTLFLKNERTLSTSDRLSATGADILDLSAL